MSQATTRINTIRRACVPIRWAASASPVLDSSSQIAADGSVLQNPGLVQKLVLCCPFCEGISLEDSLVGGNGSEIVLKHGRSGYGWIITSPLLSSNPNGLRTYPKIRERWVFCGALRRKTPNPNNFRLDTYLLWSCEFFDSALRSRCRSLSCFKIWMVACSKGGLMLVSTSSRVEAGLL